MDVHPDGGLSALLHLTPEVSMTHTIVRSICGAVALLTLSAAAFAAPAVHVRCDSYPDRSRASVDGRYLPAGDYTALLTSGANSAQTTAQAAVDGEAQFDFDSKREEVKQGATKIGKHFIVDNTVTGSIVDANGNAVATAVRQCKVH
jgi:hypothetical protein